MGVQFQNAAAQVYPAVRVGRFFPGGGGAWVQLTHWLELPEGIGRDEAGLYREGHDRPLPGPAPQLRPGDLVSLVLGGK